MILKNRSSKISLSAVLVMGTAACLSSVCRAQSSSAVTELRLPAMDSAAEPSLAEGATLPASAPHAAQEIGPFSRIAFATRMGTMGIGAEVATPLSRRTNLRMTGNFFTNTQTFSQDGVDYSGTISLRSIQTALDWFPFRGGFHISPGVLFYGGNNVTAHANVPGGDTFTLNDSNYVSSPTDPINGSGKITVNNVGPSLTVGWGNLIPRGERHYSFPFEVGAVYEGAGKIALNLLGSACDTSGCGSVTTNADFQQNLAAEQVKLNKDVEPYKFYPIISMGFAVNF